MEVWFAVYPKSVNKQSVYIHCSFNGGIYCDSGDFCTAAIKRMFASDSLLYHNTSPKFVTIITFDVFVKDSIGAWYGGGVLEELYGAHLVFIGCVIIPTRL